LKLPLFLSVVMLLLDQLTKFLVNKFILNDSCVRVISSLCLLNIVNVRNSGMTFGLLRGGNCWFVFFSILFLSPTIIWIYKKWDKFHGIQRYAFCLIVAGGLSNFIDRLMYSAVIDFLDVGINSLRWPSFNLADSCICVAVILILFDNISSYKNNV